jgi:hypothetical protein
MNYEICIGKILNLELSVLVPKRTIIINEAQREIVLMFAEKRLDEDGHPIYKINGVEFTIHISFDNGPYYKQLAIEREKRSYQAFQRRRKLKEKNESLTP